MFDDLCQEGVLALIHAYEKFDKSSSIQFWSFARIGVKFAMIAAICRYRWGTKHPKRDPETGSFYYEKAELPKHLTGGKWVDSDSRLDVERVSSILTDREYDVLFRYFVEEMTLSEIAVEYGVSRPAIGYTKRDALRKILSAFQTDA